MKKFLSVLAVLGLGVLSGCGCCGEKKSKPRKKPAAHKTVKKGDMKKKPEMKKKTGTVRSELDKVWNDVEKMWESPAKKTSK